MKVSIEVAETTLRFGPEGCSVVTPPTVTVEVTNRWDISALLLLEASLEEEHNLLSERRLALRPRHRRAALNVESDALLRKLARVRRSLRVERNNLMGRLRMARISLYGEERIVARLEARRFTKHGVLADSRRRVEEMRAEVARLEGLCAL